MSDALVEARRKLIVNTWKAYIGAPYFWGGETLSGIDCSGLIRRGWTMAAVWPFPGDGTADDLWTTCHKVGWDERRPGDVVCYRGPGDTSRCVHVCGVVDEKTLIGANGGSRPLRYGEPDQEPIQFYRARMLSLGAGVKETPSSYLESRRLGVIRSPLLVEG